MHSEETRHGNLHNDQDKYYLGLYYNLKKFVPEFETDCDSDEQYAFMYEFGKFLIDNRANTSIAERAIAFIDEALEKGTSITEEVVALQVFQQLYFDNSIFMEIRRMLSKSSVIIMDYYFLQYNKSYPSGNVSK